MISRTSPPLLCLTRVLATGNMPQDFHVQQLVDVMTSPKPSNRNPNAEKAAQKACITLIGQDGVVHMLLTCVQMF